MPTRPVIPGSDQGSYFNVSTKANESTAQHFNKDIRTKEHKNFSNKVAGK